MQGLTVRRMLDTEQSMVLSNWKRELYEFRHIMNWGGGLKDRDFWRLINHVLDRFTLPSCEVFMGCHESDVETPLCWVALRRIPGLQVHEEVYLYARKSVRQDPELAAGLQRDVRGAIEAQGLSLAKERRPYNPYLEIPQ